MDGTIPENKATATAGIKKGDILKFHECKCNIIEFSVKHPGRFKPAALEYTVPPCQSTLISVRCQETFDPLECLYNFLKIQT